MELPKGTKLYLAGPMTGYEDYNYPVFHRVEEVLTEQGYQVINPAKFFNGDQTLPKKTYLKKDIQELVECDAVVLLPGWEFSTGARIESGVASLMGIPLLFFEKDHLEQEHYFYGSEDE